MYKRTPSGSLTEPAHLPFDHDRYTRPTDNLSNPTGHPCEAEPHAGAACRAAWRVVRDGESVGGRSYDVAESSADGYCCAGVEASVDVGDMATNGAESAARVTRRRCRGRQAAVPDTKPMEQMLWDAACSIRGEKDAAKFKDYLLPLLFLKRLSDVFDDEIDRLAQEFGDRSIAQEIAESDHDLLRFYLPPEARWGIVSGREAHEWPLDAQDRSTRPRDIGEHLTSAVRAVVRHDPTLSGVIAGIPHIGSLQAQWAIQTR